MKKLCSALLAVVMVLSLSMTAFAANETEEVIDLGDGYYAVITTEVNNRGRATTITAEKSADIYQGSTQIGTGTLTATFTYDGSTSSARSASCSGRGMAGWSYKSGSASYSGSKATGDFTFNSGSTNKSFSITMTCTKYGSVT